jgi:hypothetical protein
MYAIQAISGIVMWFASQKWGINGVAISVVPVIIANPLIMARYKPDERDLQLSHEINGYSGSGIGIIAAIIYLFFPELNWYFTLMASAIVLRGIIGILIFALR